VIAPRRTLAVLTNVLAPYRVPIYLKLAQHFDLSVLYSGGETNRASWDADPALLEVARVRRVPGFTLRRTVRKDGRVVDTRFLQLQPGFLADLVVRRPDAVISNEMGLRTLCALAYATVFRRPLWVWWGGTKHTEQRVGPWRRGLRRALARRVPRWLSYGTTSSEYLRELGVPTDRIVELQNCVPEAAYASSPSPAVRIEPRPVLLHVGQLIGRKGIDRLLEACARIQRQGYSFSLLIVGDGPEREALQRLADALGLRHVHFRPAVAARDTPGVYRSADVLVFPTLEDVWGLVVNEALWSGLPVLASRYAGCAGELLGPQSTFDPLDPADFDAALVRAVRGQVPPPDRARLRRLDEVASRLVEDVESVLGARR
jgi:glycosyltransferase involved in cell wall biosynthesis